MSNPHISLVTGTFNRFPLLQRMIDSARASVPPYFQLEIVVVDGGSTDPTIDYCKRQPDVTLIQHGELRGAIRAFCDGAKAATGKYVLLANDDIVFIDDAIYRAYLHLEQHPNCGAVAFEDNRPAPGYSQDRNDFKVQFIQARNPRGELINVPYAQVGMFRRWLGNHVGWWGADDPQMGKGHTYGGDNYLSARIWELGYTIDDVRGVRCVDLMPPDNLRQHNQKMEQRNPGVYYKVFPEPPQIAPFPQIRSAEDVPALRILYAPIFEPRNKQQKESKRGLKDALIARGFIVEEVDYLNDASTNIPDRVDVLQPHLMLTQIHDAATFPAQLLAECRRRKRDTLIVNWNGDARGLDDPKYVDALHHVDLQLVVNAAPLETYRQHGIPAAYWQIGIEQDTHSHLRPVVATHDVVFLGTKYNHARAALGKALEQLRDYGVDVGLYGHGWEYANGVTIYDFVRSGALMRQAKIVISDTFNDGGNTKIDGFVSNRLIQALAAGAFVLQQECPGLDRWMGLREGVHYATWKDTDDLVLQVRRWLTKDKERVEIAQAGREYIHREYSFDKQVDRLFGEILPSFLRERAQEVQREPA